VPEAVVGTPALRTDSAALCQDVRNVFDDERGSPVSSAVVVQVFEGGVNANSGKSEYSVTFPTSKSINQIADDLFAREKGQSYMGKLFRSPASAHEAILTSVGMLFSDEEYMRAGVNITGNRIIKAHLV